MVFGDYSALAHREGAYLKRLSYGYVNLHVGVEVGARDVFRLFLRGGVTLATASLGELQAPLSERQHDAAITSSDAKVSISPFFSGKAGAAVFF